MLRSKTLRERIEGRIARKRGEDVFLTRGSFSNLKSKTNDKPQTILREYLSFHGAEFRDYKR
jgi:hypothetical protein